MSRGKKIGLAIGVAALAGGGLVAFRINQQRNAGTEVRMEPVARRDLMSTVTASGTIEAKSSVDISADITGRIVEIAVREGDIVRKGQFLLQIDPAQYEAAVARAEGVVVSSQASLLQARASRDQAERAWKRAQQLAELGRDLIAREQVEQAETAFQVADATYQAAQAQLEQARAGVRETRDNLAKTRLMAPMAGRVVRLAVEEGEVAVPGTFSRETGLLMTIADLSVMLAKVQVDETDVVRLARNDSVEVTIDAFPDTTFVGRVTQISHGAKLTGGSNPMGTTGSAVDFDVEITLRDLPPDIRPDLSCTARIVTDTRTRALTVPIIALTVRDHKAIASESAPHVDTTGARGKKPEAEGVFVVRDGIARFRPVKVGIAGEEHFEVVEGLQEGEVIVAGSYQAIRDLQDSARVTAADSAKAPDTGQ